MRTVPSDVHDAHERVPASHWCVTKQDLVYLRRVVREEVDRGHVTPTALDPFDPSDNTYGPCVHTVVVQLIKPACNMAGGSSWALVQHPCGLKCDLFVTHAWAEGIYEFIDKVLYSWPPGTRHAYCCMLSNPQTLDIGHLIASPSESPFAKALTSATHVLVVPNRKESIYARSWCTYEAYLAYKWDKTLEVALAPVYGIRRQVLLMACLGFVFAIVPAALLSECSKTTYTVIDRCLAALELATVMLPSSYRITAYAINFLGMCFGGAKLGQHFIWSWNRYNNATSFAALIFVIDELIQLLHPAAFIFSQCDVLWHQQMGTGQTQLERGYSGQLCDSKASFEQDKQMILEEIRSTNSEDAVDETIAVLLKSGMSTTSLRVAHELGVDIAGVGVIKLKYLWVCMYALACQLLSHRIPSMIEKYGELWAGVAISVTWSAGFWWLRSFFLNRHSRDRKAFLASSAWKLLGLPSFVWRIVHELLRVSNIIRSATATTWFCMILPACSCCAALTAVVDLGTLASMPKFGVALAQFTATNDVGCCRRRCAHPARDPMSGLSRKTDEIWFAQNQSIIELAG